MSEYTSAPPPLPPIASTPKSKWRWLKIAVGTIAAAFLATGVIGSYSSDNLEFVRRDLFDAARDGKVLEITNVGSKPIKLMTLKVNDRLDCTVHRLDAILGNATPLFPSTLSVGDKLSISGSCRIVKVTVETDQGFNSYSFRR
jgi:hypothetical protein